MANCEEYNLLQWIALERQQLGAELSLEMKAHRDSCSDCRECSELARKVLKSGSLASEQPPESWIEEAAERFETPVPTVDLPLIAELVSDSVFENTAPLRSVLMASRRLAFELPALKIDVLLEYSGTQLEMVMGHLVPANPDAPSRAQVVELYIDDEVLKTTPNELGEFLFSVMKPLSGSALQLKCIFEEGPCAVVLMPS